MTYLAALKQKVKDNSKIKNINTIEGIKMADEIQLEADDLGFFGEFGKQYVPETLMPAIQELNETYQKLKMIRLS